MIRHSLTVGAGAMFGALARFSAELILGAGIWPLLVVNILGSFLTGALRPGPFWGSGVLGGFTSFSTFAVLVASASPMIAGGYVIATVVGCLSAWLIGDYLAAS